MSAATCIGYTPECGKVHIYVLRLAGSAEAAERCHAFLDDREENRYKSLPRGVESLRFVFAHGVLRALLAKVLQAADPSELRFRRGAGSKPRIEFPETNLRFNLSHSDNVVVFALAQGFEVGIDVEKVEPRDNAMRLASRFFCRDEAMELEAVHESERLEEFYRYWTRKEAYLKAIGTGLAFPLDEILVSRRAGEPARLRSSRRECDVELQSTLASILLDPGYVGTVAVCAKGKEVKMQCAWMTADEALVWLGFKATSTFHIPGRN